MRTFGGSLGRVVSRCMDREAGLSNRGEGSRSGTNTEANGSRVQEKFRADVLILNVVQFGG